MFDHWVGGGSGIDDETTFAVGVVCSGALAALLFGSIVPKTKQAGDADLAARQAIAAAIVGLAALPALILGVAVVFGAAAITFGAIGVDGPRRRLAIVAILLGLAPVGAGVIDVIQGGDNPEIQVIR